VRWVWWGAALVAAVGLLATAWRLTVRHGPAAAEYRVPGSRLPHTIEVLNGTDVDGLARTVTFRLRRAGLDVVSFGTAAEPAGDSTLVLVRSADTAAGWTVREALGFGRVVVEPNARLLLDVTVVLGRDAAPSSER
jgi:hypothetical protein